MHAAAGVLLIGAVGGDTDRAEEITHTIAPIRDTFAALFFVSIVMLVDFSQIAEFIGPVLDRLRSVHGWKEHRKHAGVFFTDHPGPRLRVPHPCRRRLRESARPSAVRYESRLNMVHC